MKRGRGRILQCTGIVVGWTLYDARVEMGVRREFGTRRGGECIIEAPGHANSDDFWDGRKAYTPAALAKIIELTATNRRQ